MIKTYKELKKKIMVEKKFVDIKPFIQNLINFYLQRADKELGREEANRLIKECKLEKLGWHIVEEK